MELVINYGLYFIALFCVMTPLLGFGVFAPLIAKTTLVGFVVNWIAQFNERSKEGKVENKFFKGSHSENKLR